LDIVIWAPLKKLFATPDVPSWLRACLELQRCRFRNLRSSRYNCN